MQRPRRPQMRRILYAIRSSLLSPAARLVVFDIIAVHGLAARTFDGLRQAEVPPITVAAISRVPIAASSNFWYQKKARPHFASRPLLNRGNRRNIAVSSLKREQIYADQGIKCTEIFQNYYDRRRLSLHSVVFPFGRK